MANTVSIAPARTTDVQIIAEMSRRLIEVGLPWTWTPARVARHLVHPDTMALVARAGPTVAGFAIMHFGDEVAHLNLLAVDSRFQRSGLGRRLVEWLEQSAVVAGTFTVCLETRARNPVALLFYRRLGYRESGRIPRYYSGREDAVRLTRDLRAAGARRAPGQSPQSSAPPGAATGDAPPQTTAQWLLTRFRR